MSGPTRASQPAGDVPGPRRAGEDGGGDDDRAAALTDLRYRIADALRDRVNQAPQRPTLDGPTGLSEITVGMTELADAVLAIVQPELDRLRDSIAEKTHQYQLADADRAAAERLLDGRTARMKQAERERDGQALDRNRWRARAHQAEAAIAAVAEDHDHTCNLRQATRRHPEGRFAGATCGMCALLRLPPALGQPTEER